MSLISQAILLAAIIILGETALITAITAKNTTKDFVDVLKLKLRKNNDDYAELLLQNTTAKEITTPVYKNKTELEVLLFNKDQPSLNVGDLRRSFDEPNNDTQDISITRQHVSYTTNIPTTISTNKSYKNGTRPHFRSDYKTMNKNKIENFKKFMSKNKNLFSEYLNKKRTAAQTAHAPTLAGQPVATSSRPILRGMNQRDITFMRVEESTKAKDSSWKEAPSPMYRAYSKKSSLVTPSAEEIDMAPAKGSRIHVMRLKGRLCQRNVMIPEGPKYDSKGQMYLGGYTNKYGRDYSHTRRPKIVLPRCCNCCKKSVLGCE